MVEETKAAEKPEEAKPDAKAQVTAAEASKSPTVPMQAPDGATEVSVSGKVIKVPKTGRIEAEIKHVEELIAHGFEVIVKEVEKL